MEAKAAAYPHAGLTGGVTSDLRERGDNPDVYGVSWSVTQPLWRSGAVSAAIRYARLYGGSTDEAIRQQVQDTVAAATEGFLGVLLAQQMVNVYTESAAVAERMLETARKKRNAGSASDYEVLRAEVEVASTRAALIKERNALRSRVIGLLQTIAERNCQRETVSITIPVRDRELLRDLSHKFGWACIFNKQNVAMV